MLTVLVTWWYGPIDLVNSNGFSPAVFGARDLVPVGYAAFAFGLGVAAGVVTRRTLTAMAVTLVGYVAVRLSFAFWVRPHLLAPLTAVAAARRPRLARSCWGAARGPPPGGGSSPRRVTDPSGAAIDTIRIARGRPVHGHAQLPERLPRDDGLPARRPLLDLPVAGDRRSSSASALALVGVAYWWLRRRLS